MSKTALIVDDSKLSRMMIASIIKENFSDWNIVEAIDGESALALAETTAIDCMTIDVNMPGMSGTDLGAKLREKFPEASIAMVTANVQDAIRQRAASYGAEFIEKPISEDKIMGFLQMEKVDA